ncbi:MAG: YggT family protein [Candidatus Velthaea sp.]
MIPCSLYTLVGWFFQLYILAMLAYALVSWVPSIRGRWSDYLAMVVEPVLQPIRRIIPPIGGLDLSFLVLIIVIQLVVANFVRPYTCAY